MGFLSGNPENHWGKVLPEGDELKVFHFEFVGNRDKVTNKTHGLDTRTENTSFVFVSHNGFPIFENDSFFGVTVRFGHCIILSFLFFEVEVIITKLKTEVNCDYFLFYILFFKSLKIKKNKQNKQIKSTEIIVTKLKNKVNQNFKPLKSLTILVTLQERTCSVNTTVKHFVTT